MKNLSFTFTKRIYTTILFSVIALFLFTTINTSAYDTTGINNDEYNENLSLDIKRPRFSMDTVLKWTPESDPDAFYARSTVPLRTGRFYGPQINPNATPGAKFQHCAFLTMNGGAQGHNSFQNYAFTHWQYLDSMVGWAEDAGKGILVCPTADAIDMAHRNGVAVTAGLFFPYGPNDAGVQEMRKLVKTDLNGRFPTIDKLAQIARFYGFDGYFFNQETSGCYAHLQGLKNALRYARLNYPELVFNWYDSMTFTDGGVNYGNGLNGSNVGWFGEDQELKNKKALKPYLIDDFFTNYNWSSSTVDESNRLAKRYNRSPYDVYIASNFQQYGLNTDYQFDWLKDANGKLKASIGAYCLNSTVGEATTGEQFHELENYFWSSRITKDGEYEYDPRNNGDKFGMSQYLLDKSVINRFPFNSTFNTGHGKKFFIDGKLEIDEEWTNRSLQEITPTWTWMVDSNASKKLRAGYDFETAWNGGNSLALKGNVESEKYNELKLYSTRLRMQKDIKFRLTYKETGDNATIQALISRGQNKYEWTENITLNKVETKNGWTIAECIIPRGELINGVGIKVTNNISGAYTLNIGQLQMLGNAKKVTKLGNPIVENIYYRNNSAEARVHIPTQKSVKFYEIWMHDNLTNQKKLLKVSSNSYAYVHNMFPTNGAQSVYLTSIPVNENGERLTHLESNITEQVWKKTPKLKEFNAGNNLFKDGEVFAYSKFGNTTENVNKAVDGKGDWGSKWTCVGSYGDYVCVKLPEAREAGFTRICAGGVTTTNFGDSIDEVWGYASKKFEIFCTEEEISKVDCDDVYHNGSSPKFTKCATITNPKKNNEIVFEFDKKYKGKYWLLKITETSAGQNWGSMTLFDWQLYNVLGSPYTNVSSIKYTVHRKSENTGDIEVEYPKNVELKFYDKVDGSVIGILPKHNGFGNSKMAKRTLENVALKKEGGILYYTAKHEKLNESSFTEIEYLPYNDGSIPDTPVANQSDIMITRLKYSNRYNRGAADGYFVKATIRNLAPGTVVTLKQTNPYKRVDTFVANSEGIVEIRRIYIPSDFSNPRKNKFSLKFYKEGKMPNADFTDYTVALP